jgi:hypothetical protein
MEKLPRVDRVLDDLRSLGAEIIDFDFGYPVEEATFEQGATESRIEAIAAVIGKPLPSDYAYFLSRCAGFTGMDFQNGYVVHRPEEVIRLSADGGPAATPKWGDRAIPHIQVAADGGGNLFLLQVGPPHAVLRRDHESGVTEPISDSFVSFLERIREDWKHFLSDDPESWTYIT